MEKISTLLKTCATALCNLLLLRGYRIIPIVNKKRIDNSQWPSDNWELGIGNWSVVSGQWSMANSVPLKDEDTKSIKDDKSSSKESLNQVNDELANHPYKNEPVYNWKTRVNDDLAACTAVDDPLFPPIKNSVKRKNENIIDHIFFVNDTTTINNKTKASKDDAFLPFASFSFLCKKFSQSIFNAVELSTTQKLIF